MISDGGANRFYSLRTQYSCHRVVNHAGRTAPGWPEQARLLAEEGVPFRGPGQVDLGRCQWAL